MGIQPDFLEAERYAQQDELRKSFFNDEQAKADRLTEEQRNHLEILKHYTSVDQKAIPPDFFKANWAVFSKEFALSFLHESDIPFLDLQMMIVKLSTQMSKPSYQMSWEDVQNTRQLDLYWLIQAKRAIGTKDGVFNERKAEITQINQRNSSSMVDSIRKRGGFLGLLDKSL